MSSMLEQAIIDAAALRETAMKSAEASLIEKYNKEFKQTVEKLLEQEMEPATAAANAADPTGPTVAPTDPMTASAAGTPAPAADKKDVFSKVKTAFFDLEGDDDELITINFDGLKARPAEETPASLSSPSSQAPSLSSLAAEPSPAAALEESLELELDEMYNAGRNTDADRYGGFEEEEEEEELEESDTYEESEEELELELEEAQSEKQKVAPQVASLQDSAAKNKQRAAADEAKANTIKADASKKDAERLSKAPKSEEEEELEETIELSEDELAELEEALHIDMTNEYEGYMGSHKRKQREFKSVAFAKARDDKKTEKREKMKKTLADLQESLKQISVKFQKEQELNNDLVSTLSQLKEQVEQTNLSNAKLLYTNKTLSNASLNERQKQQIVENIAKADSVLEAKTIYETLQSAVASKPETAPKSLSEAINRGNSPFLARPKQAASINDLMAERMKLLAGIKHKN